MFRENLGTGKHRLRSWIPPPSSSRLYTDSNPEKDEIPLKDFGVGEDEGRVTDLESTYQWG